MTVTVRALGPAFGSGYTGAGTTVSATIPAGVQSGDLAVVIISAYTYQAGGNPVIVPGANLTAFTRKIDVTNTGRGIPTHTVGVFAAEVPASMAGQTVSFTVPDYPFYYQTQVIVYAGPVAFVAAGSTTTGATYSTTADVADLLGAVTADEIISVVSAQARDLNTAGITFTGDASATILGQAPSAGPLYPNVYGSAQLVASAATAGAHPFTASLPSSAITAQFAIRGNPSFNDAPLRSTSVATAAWYSPSGSPTFTVPWLVEGDTIMLVWQGGSWPGVAAPAFTAVGTLLTQFVQVIYHRDNTRTTGHSLAVWMLRNAPASMAGQTLQINVGEMIGSGQIIVLKGTVFPATATTSTTGAVTTTTVNVPDTGGAASVYGVLSIASLITADTNVTATIGTGTEIVLAKDGRNGGNGFNGQYHVVTYDPATGPATYTSNLQVAAITGQIGLSAAAPPGYTNTHPLAAGGSIGGARGVKAVNLTARVVSAPAYGSLATPANTSITVPAGVVTGDTIILVGNVIAGSGPSLLRGATGPITTFTQVIDGRNTGRAQALSVFVLRDAAASLSGQTLTVAANATSGTFYYLLQVFVLRGSDLDPYLPYYASADSGAAMSTTVAVADLLGAVPASRVLNIVGIKCDTVTPTFTGTAVIGQSAYPGGSTALMVGAGTVPGPYQYTCSLSGSTVTAQLGFSSGSGAGPGVDNLHPLTGSAAVGAGRGHRSVTGRHGALTGAGVVAGRAGVRVVWPVPVRAIGAPVSGLEYDGFQEIVIPAGVADGDMIVVAVAAAAYDPDNTAPVITPSASGPPKLSTAARAVDIVNGGRAPHGHSLLVLVLPDASSVLAGTSGYVTVTGFQDYYIFQSQVLVFKGPARVDGAAATSTGAMCSVDTDVGDLLGDTVCDQVLNVLGVMSKDPIGGVGPFTADTAQGPILVQGTYNGGTSRYSTGLMFSQGLTTDAYPYTFPMLASALSGQLALTADSPVRVSHGHPLVAGGQVRSTGGRTGGGDTIRHPLAGSPSLYVTGEAVGTGEDYAHDGHLAVGATITGRGYKSWTVQGGGLAGVGSVVATGHMLTGPGAGTLTGAVALVCHTAGHGSYAAGTVTASGALIGRTQPKAATGRGSLLGWVFVYGGTGHPDREWHAALHAGGLLRATGRGQRRGGITGIGVLSASVPRDDRTGQGRLTAAGALTGRGLSARYGRGVLAGAGVLAEHGGPNFFGQGGGELLGVGELLVRWRTHRTGAGGVIVGVGEVGGGFGYIRGGYATPLVGVGAVGRGVRRESALPIGPFSAGFDEGSPKRRASTE